MMTSDEAREKIRTDPDFIYIPRFDFSLEKMVLRYPDGVPEKLIAQALMMTEDELRLTFESAVKKLRASVGVDDE